MKKEVILTGSTGLIGSKIFTALNEKGYSVKVFSRNPREAESKLIGAEKYVYWDYTQPETWRNEIDGVYGIIHLAGANLFAQRWTKKYKQEIIDSRVISSNNIVNEIGESSNKPVVFVCASGIGYYGDKGEKKLNEDAAAGNDYLAKVCANWESEAFKARKFNVRVATIRTGVVLSNDDGTFPLMQKAFRFFVGGALGSGKQYFPWIHIDDVVNIYLFALENELMRDGINAVAPEDVTMNQFANKMGKSLNRPSFFKVPKLGINIALGEFGKSIIMSQRAVPEKLLKSGFKFKYDNLNAALENLGQCS